VAAEEASLALLRQRVLSQTGIAPGTKFRMFLYAYWRVVWNDEHFPPLEELDLEEAHRRIDSFIEHREWPHTDPEAACVVLCVEKPSAIEWSNLPKVITLGPLLEDRQGGFVIFEKLHYPLFIRSEYTWPK
jgi:hypothetical protein